jgi:hypothetical protein
LAGLFGLVGGLSGREVEAKLRGNQGIRRSARTAILVSLIVLLAFTVVPGLISAVISGPGGVVGWLNVGLVLGLNIGLACGLVFGGYACLSHAALRLMLWRIGVLPLRTIRFLDYATERVFLRKVGGGYIFVHRLLQEYFADLWAQP